MATKAQTTEPIVKEENPEQEERALEQRLAALEARIAELEKHAHTEHAIGPEVVQQIAAHASGQAVNHINEHLRRAFGHSGMPLA